MTWRIRFCSPWHSIVIIQIGSLMRVCLPFFSLGDCFYLCFAFHRHRRLQGSHVRIINPGFPLFMLEIRAVDPSRPYQDPDLLRMRLVGGCA
jgi:hypothetical protein